MADKPSKFGKYDSFEKFIEAYEQSRQEQEQAAEAELTASQRRRRRRRARERDVVEVGGTIRVREEDDNDGSQHHRLRLVLTEIFENDPDVEADVQRNLDNGTDVFVAIRFGDRMGILQPVDGLDEGAEITLRGEWISKENAQSHGGEPLSVLHFTHHPIGFVCTAERCFS